MLDGKWQLVSGENDGEVITQPECQQSTLEIVGEKHTVVLPNGVIRGTHTFDPSQNPPAIDADEFDGLMGEQEMVGIYEADGDFFTVCFSAPGEPRPTKFTTQNGHALFLHKWQRIPA